VLVAGWPGSGKSTLAAALAAELGLPLLAKDEIKEALMEVLGQPETVAASQRLGKAAVLAMLRAARTCPGGVLDSTWFGDALPLARTLPGRLIEVHRTVPLDLAGPGTGPEPVTVMRATSMTPAPTRSYGVSQSARWGSVPLSWSIPPARWTSPSSLPPWPKRSLPPEAAPNSQICTASVSRTIKATSRAITAARAIHVSGPASVAERHRSWSRDSTRPDRTSLRASL
jgi:AAA domain